MLTMTRSRRQGFFGPPPPYDVGAPVGLRRSRRDPFTTRIVTDTTPPIPEPVPPPRITTQRRRFVPSMLGIRKTGFPTVRAPIAYDLIAFTRTEAGRHALLNAFTRTEQGMHRIANEALNVFEFYIGEDAEPDFTAAPDETASSLPHTTAAITLPGAGETKVITIGVRRRNAYGLRSEDIDFHTFTIDENGDAVTVAPLPPDQDSETIAAAASAAVYITADFTTRRQHATLRPDAWLIYLTSDGSTPDPSADTPLEVAMVHRDGVAKLRYTSTTFSNGATIKVVIRTRRSGSSDVDSVNVIPVLTVTASTAGPGDILSGRAFTDFEAK